MENELENIDYQDYIKWKGWLAEGHSFFCVSKTEAAELESQFRASKVRWKDIRVLELGYGSGKLLRFLHDNGCEVAGVEVQKDLLQAANDQGLTAYRNITEAQGEYDLIVAFDVLEHLSIDQLRELFSAAFKRLDVDGRMLFRFPNGDSYAGMPAQNGDYTHITSIGQSKLQQLIAPYGLVIESFQGAIEYPHRPISRAIHWVFRSLLIKLIGFGRPYFFSGNVVAVIRRVANI
jgi:2-polyprenyl-3-methyl-5-hydroxy-6-metoxy-1,4-benzoquinol methylase